MRRLIIGISILIMLLNFFQMSFTKEKDDFSFIFPRQSLYKDLITKLEKDKENKEAEIKKLARKKVIKKVKPVSRGGEKVRKEFIAKASAYTWTGNRTASGVYPKANHTVAVDKKYISLGSTIQIYTLEGSLIGDFKAEDTGGHIKVDRTGRLVDIYFDTKKEAIKWGVRKVRVVVLD